MCTTTEFYRICKKLTQVSEHNEIRVITTCDYGSCTRTIPSLDIVKNGSKGRNNRRVRSLKQGLNMRYSSKIMFLGIAALLFGSILAVPLFQFNRPPFPSSFERPFISVDVPYTYLSFPQYSAASGLSDNLTSGALVNSIFVVNITNYSNVSLYINGISVYAADSINTTNTQVEFSQFLVGTFLTQNIGFNQYSGDIREASRTLVPYGSTLVALSGNIEIGNTSALKSGVFSLGAKLDCSVGDWHSTWGGSKQVQVQRLGNEFLYNDLTSSGQTLRIQGSYVYIK
jgi:hypothetical protein